MIMQRLSLLARGTRLHAKIPVVGARFIPAGAGNTVQDSAPTETGAVYPRWRGEHYGCVTESRLWRGLSPLARGTQNLGIGFINYSRFIPAGAGNTVTPSSLLIKSPVYPRWRGEHHDHVPENAGCTRFIPAGAGNTSAIRSNPVFSAVYPRWRGEHGLTPPRYIQAIGLSPLARGTLNRVIHLIDSCRFIPAGAGNTCR